jgi:vancomycin resistance protein YoaR
MAVSEGTLEDRRSIRFVRPGRRFLAFVIGTLLGVGAVVGGLAAAHQAFTGRILPGVYAADVDLSGLTPDEARIALQRQYGRLAEGGLQLRTGLGSTAIAFADVGRAADIDGLVSEAAAAGRGGSWLDETAAAARMVIEPVGIPLRLRYDHDRAAAAVRSFAERKVLRPTDASARRDAGGFTVIPGVEGRRIDVTGALAAVDAAMIDPSQVAGAMVEASVLSIDPSVTTADAEAARQAAARMGVNVRVKHGTTTWTIKAAKVRGWIGFAMVDGDYRAVLDESAIPSALKAVSKKVARPALDAAFLKDKHGHVVGAMADRAGRALDAEATADRIATAVETRAPDAGVPTVKAAIVAVAPKRTTGQVTKSAPLMVKIGSWATYYEVSAHNGFGANITVPARYLNGTVVKPGQVFDFWDSLGEVSFRTGYRLGGAIVGGHSVEGKALAGGICATSTTLFNAALRAGLEIDARQPHWYYITRYPLGLDATVSDSQTMRFRNDTSKIVLIRGFASPGVVRFEIWAEPTGRTVSLSRPRVTNVVPGYDTTVKTNDLPKGKSERIEWPVDGKDVSVTRTVRDANGRVIHRETYISHYHRMVGILRVGTR